MFLMTHIFMVYMPDKKIWHCLVPGYGFDWLTRFIVNHSLDLSENLEVLFFRTIIVRLSRLELFDSFQIFCTVLRHLHTVKSSSWIFPVNTKHFWKSVLHNGVAFSTDTAKLTHVCCSVDKTWNKQSVCTKLFIQNSNNLPVGHYIYIYVCVCVCVCVIIRNVPEKVFVATTAELF